VNRQLLGNHRRKAASFMPLINLHQLQEHLLAKLKEGMLTPFTGMEWTRQPIPAGPWNGPVDPY